MIGNCIENVRKKAPIIHNITNYVTANDVANVLLACGGSPVMSDEPEDMEELTSICDGLNINIGTLNKNSIESMLIAGRKANELGHKVILDPVGAGTTTFRTNTALQLVKEIHFDVIRGNISEIKTLFYGCGTTKGVDAQPSDTVTEENLNRGVALAKAAADRYKCIIVITSVIDIVTDGETCYVIRNGCREMKRITGTGCQLSGLIAAFAAANSGNELEAVAAAVCTMGGAGEIGLAHMQDGEGNATYRNRIIDAVYNMDGRLLGKIAKYEVM